MQNTFEVEYKLDYKLGRNIIHCVCVYKEEKREQKLENVNEKTKLFNCKKIKISIFLFILGRASWKTNVNSQMMRFFFNLNIRTRFLWSLIPKKSLQIETKSFRKKDYRPFFFKFHPMFTNLSITRRKKVVLAEEPIQNVKQYFFFSKKKRDSFTFIWNLIRMQIFAYNSFQLNWNVDAQTPLFTNKQHSSTVRGLV